MESKKDIYNLIPQQYYPKTVYVKHGTPPEVFCRQLDEQEFQYPLIGKPDIGERGRAVKKLYDRHDLMQYAQDAKTDFLIQECVPYQLEAGIFYYRYPGKTQGHLSGIVYKEFLSVVGDGRSTILQLMQQSQRHILQLEVLEKTMGDQLHEVLASGEKQVLVPYGNHCRGARFIDASSEIDEQLTATLDKICSQISGFFYGRMDIRFSSWEELRRGENFSIIELNGAGSEPTHIYDPGHTIWFAWKEIIRHWNILFRISMLNKRQYPFMPFKDGIAMFRESRALDKIMQGEDDVHAAKKETLQAATVVVNE